MDKYIITSVQKWAVVNKEFYRNMKAFAKKHEVTQIYVFLLNWMYKDVEDISKTVTEDKDIKIIYNSNVTLNENLRLFDSKILPQSVDPFRWLAEKISQQYSYIVPSPKVRYQAVWNYPSLPRCLISTGALTNPRYKTHTQTGVKAEQQHQLWFTYVEVHNKKTFTPIPVMATRKGTFHFMKEKYTWWNCLPWKIEAIIAWDWHTLDTCPKVRKKTIEIIEDLKPKYFMFHDFFNWHSINHHEEHDSIARTRTMLENRSWLEKEVKVCRKELKFFGEKFPNTQFKVVYSNHDDFLRRYVANDKHMRDLRNRTFAEDLWRKLIDRKSIALEEAIRLVWDLPSNIWFLDRSESFKVRWVELAIHWDQWVNGSRWSPHQYRRLNLKVISGHTHTPSIYSNWMVVGTSTKLNLDYTKGWVSSWLNAHWVLYPDGNFTLITIL